MSGTQGLLVVGARTKLGYVLYRLVLGWTWPGIT